MLCWRGGRAVSCCPVMAIVYERHVICLPRTSHTHHPITFPAFLDRAEQGHNLPLSVRATSPTAILLYLLLLAAGHPPSAASSSRTCLNPMSSAPLPSVISCVEAVSMPMDTVSRVEQEEEGRDPETERRAPRE